MDTEIRFHYHPHLLGASATHPIEPRYGTLAALLRLTLHEPAALSPLQGAAQSQPAPVRAVHWHAGASGAAALTFASAPHHGPLGRVQLPFLGLNR